MPDAIGGTLGDPSARMSAGIFEDRLLIVRSPILRLLELLMVRLRDVHVVGDQREQRRKPLRHPDVLGSVGGTIVNKVIEVRTDRLGQPRTISPSALDLSEIDRQRIHPVFACC
jgi:hypothetical protein